MARKLIHIVRMVALMDVRAVLVGMKPSVAITLTDMNVSFSNITTALNLEKGLAALRRALK
jgi:rsbT antagonist protein RsbS